MTAEAIAKVLGGYRAGATWMARCPAHDDRNPSLAISADKGGRVLVHCYAAFSQREVIAALIDRGLWDARVEDAGRSFQMRRNRAVSEADPNAEARTDAALTIWRASQVAEGTLVQAYLRSRGLVVPVPPTLRFHPGMKHPSGGIWPSMVALVTHGETGSPIGIHRTFLARNGFGKAPFNPTKMMLGPCGGGAVRLSEPGKVLMVGEGIETCLAAMQVTGNPAWAAISTSGLRSLNLPREVRDVIVLADGDDAGEAAAQHCARRWKSERRKVRIARPLWGLDFNDMLGNPSFNIDGSEK